MEILETPAEINTYRSVIPVDSGSDRRIRTVAMNNSPMAADAVIAEKRFPCRATLPVGMIDENPRNKIR
jgi:hypothetical protein